MASRSSVGRVRQATSQSKSASGRGRGIEPRVAVAPELGVLGRELAHELADLRHGLRKRIVPMKASALDLVSSESTETETAPGLSASSP